MQKANESKRNCSIDKLASKNHPLPSTVVGPNVSIFIYTLPFKNRYKQNGALACEIRLRENISENILSLLILSFTFCGKQAH